MIEKLISKYDIILSFTALMTAARRRSQIVFELAFLSISSSSLLNIFIMSVLLNASEEL